VKVCSPFILLLDVAPASPFIVPKGRARVTFVVKKSEMGKDEREKQKKVALGVTVFLIIRRE
jgi:hypothetical protein